MRGEAARNFNRLVPTPFFGTRLRRQTLNTIPPATQARETSYEKYPSTLILSPDPELSTPTESRHTTCLLGGKSPSVKLMSRRELLNYKELAKTNIKNMDRTMQELQHIGSITISSFYAHFQLSSIAAIKDT